MSPNSVPSHLPSSSHPARGRSLASFVLLFFAAFALGSMARADVSLQWQDGDADVDQLLANALADSNILSDFVELVDENFHFEPPLVLAIGANGGPDYNTETHVLRMPYGYLAEATAAQSALSESRERALERALDMVEYTLYFLLGQALIDDSRVEADAAAEALATWVMVSHWPNGGEQFFEAVDAFGAASQKHDGQLSEFWHQHALYRLRQETLHCWILGSNPDAHERLMPSVLDAAERRERCRDEWNTLDAESARQLAPLLKSEAPLRRKG